MFDFFLFCVFIEVLVDSITEVREGHQSDVFRQSRGLYNPARCLSIVYGSQYEQLDLVAPTELKASQWIVGLRSLVRKSAGKRNKTVV